MALYVLPKGSHISDKGRGAEPGIRAQKTDPHGRDLYEVPKKHH